MHKAVDLSGFGQDQCCATVGIVVGLPDGFVHETLCLYDRFCYHAMPERPSR